MRKTPTVYQLAHRLQETQQQVVHKLYALLLVLAMNLIGTTYSMEPAREFHTPLEAHLLVGVDIV
jgi:hypothetical protein